MDRFVVMAAVQLANEFQTSDYISDVLSVLLECNRVRLIDSGFVAYTVDAFVTVTFASGKWSYEVSDNIRACN